MVFIFKITFGNSCLARKETQVATGLRSRVYSHRTKGMRLRTQFKQTDITKKLLFSIRAKLTVENGLHIYFQARACFRIPIHLV